MRNLAGTQLMSGWTLTGTTGREKHPDCSTKSSPMSMISFFFFQMGLHRPILPGPSEMTLLESARVCLITARLTEVQDDCNWLLKSITMETHHYCTRLCIA